MTAFFAEPRKRALVSWAVSAGALLAGILCAAAPVFWRSGAPAHPPYGTPLIPWFATAYANLDYTDTAIALFAVAIVLGALQPNRWLVNAVLGIAGIVILHTINLMHDLARSPTSHNLWPFEYAFLLTLAVPSVIGAFLGSLLRKGLSRAHG